jgi:elongation of very long chain fatty acids protein 6
MAYIGLMIVGQRFYFANRKPWDWRQTMALWNLSLSTFSAIGFIRTAPQLLHNLTNYTWRQNFCFDPESHYGSGSTGLWVQLFILSKFPELLDTFFIVIHKKPVIFLHWYHHVSVLLYCWHSYVTKAPTGIVFCVMNYAVHAIMYFYYFLMAVHMKPKAFQAVYITAAQISQMVVGVMITTIGCYLLWVEGPPDNCWLTPDNNVAALVMYGSYLFLFLEFFWQRYNKKSKKSSAGKSAIKKPVKKE